MRQTRPDGDIAAGNQLLDERSHGFRADQQRLAASAHVQQPVGKDVAAFEIGRKLDFVDGNKGQIEILGHRLDGGDPIAGMRRFDLLLARDQCHRLFACAINQTAIDLARQQSERQADQTTSMRQHPLDRIMRLARIGGTQYGGHATGALVDGDRAGHCRYSARRKRGAMLSASF